MIHLPRSLLLFRGPVLAVQLACARAPASVGGAEVSPADSIPESEIRQEMQSVRGIGDFYPILFLLAGGGVGALAGWQLGCQLGIGGGVDPGLDGCVIGGLFGALGGAAGGMMIGIKLGEEERRAEAIRRIRARRAQDAQSGH